MFRFLSVFFVAVSVCVAGASPTSLNFQGRIVKSNGLPLEHSSVSFIFQITEPQGTCVLYQEQLDSYNMANSNGIFDIPIGLGTRSWPATGVFTVLDSMNNSAPSLTCQGGSTYIPAADDIRKLRVLFHDGNGWKTISPDSKIRTVPFAGYSASAAKLGTHGVADFILKGAIPTCDPGHFLTWSGTALTCEQATGTSTGISGVSSANGDIVVTNGSTAPVLTLNSGIGAGQILKLNSSSQIPAVDGSLITNLSSANLATTVPVSKGGTGQTSYSDGQILVGNSAGNTLSKQVLSGDATMNNAGLLTVRGIKGTAVSAAPSTDGQVLRYDGSSWTPGFVSMFDLRSTVTGTNTFGGGTLGCTASQTLTWIAATDNLACTNISISMAQVTSGTLPVANGGTGVASLPGTFVLNGGQSGNVNLGTTSANDLTLSTSGSAKVTVTSDGKVGIGIETPSGALDVSSTSGSFVPPRMTTTQRNALATPPNGSVIYNTTTTRMNFRENGTWVEMGSGGNGGRTSCPTGFSLIGTSGSAEAFCISTDEEATGNWLAAATACYNKTPTSARLCSAGEWAMACISGVPSNMNNNWEWVADLSYYGNGQVMGNTTCSSFGDSPVSTIYTSRCCFR